MRQLLRGLVVTLTLVGAGVLGGTAYAGATPPSCDGPVGEFTTEVLDRPDSGLGGTWAKDTFTRTTVVYRNADCTYGITLRDEGTFTTLANAPSPGGTATLGASFTGTFTGGAQITVISDVPPVDPPATSDGTVSSSQWAMLLFPDNPGKLNEWGWTYTTPCETWLNAHDGNQGDVTGKVCETETSTTTTTDQTTSTTIDETTSTTIETTDSSTTSNTSTSRTTTSYVWPATSTTALVGSSGPDDVDLASTGVSYVGPLVALAVLLFAAGVAFVALRRQRRTDID
jgi:hypothetical protein